jgi:ATP-dependent helicase/nuclease subunit B
VRFLSIATELWPKRLDKLGLVDVNVRRTRLLRVLAEQWTHNPPPRALIAAGSTGTAPATAELLRVISMATAGGRWCCPASISSWRSRPGTRWATPIRRGR